MSDPQALPVSVVIPAYRSADYILACVESTLAATPVPREIIVVNDGSPDNTEELLAPLVNASRIRYVSQANAGMAAARNAGAALATSKYLYFLDADDLVFPDALVALVSELELHAEAGMASGLAVLFSGDPPEAPRMPLSTRAMDRTRSLRFNPIGSPGQVLIRRSAFEEIGGFDFGFPGVEDWDLWLRLLERYPGRWVRQPVLAYRLHNANSSRNVARMYDSSLRVARRHIGRLAPSQRPVMRAFTYRALRAYHVPRLQSMLSESAARREWRLATTAARAWLVAWATDAMATLQLKRRLAARGRWRLTADEQLA